MSKIKFIFILTMILSTFTIFSQDNSNWVNGKTIVGIEFEGLNNVDEKELDEMVTPYIGESFSDELFLELQTMMYELDYFEIIVPNAKPGDSENNSVILVFQLQESPAISKIIFEGNDSIWNTELFSTISIEDKDIYSDFKVKKATDDIINLYKDNGYPNVTVEASEVLSEVNNSVEVTFIINEGVQNLIKEITLHGNNIYASDGKLRSLIDTKAKSLFNDGVLREDTLKNDILKIENLYHNNGYINAKVVDVQTKLEDDPENENAKNIFIDIFLEEGDLYTYGGTTFQGNNVYTTKEFTNLDTMKIGDTYSKSQHEAMFIKIQSLYYDNGYIENSFNDQKDINDESKVVSHNITIIESGVANVGNIYIKGNEKTKDIVILREIKIKPGDVFSRQKVWDTMSNIMSTGVFTNTVPLLTKNENGDMDLTFQVEEARTINLMGGISITGSDFQPALSFSVKDQNFMGMGRTFGGSLSLGSDTQEVSLEYNEPRIFDSNFFGGISLSWSHKLEDMFLYGGEDSDGRYPKISGETINSYSDYEAWFNDGKQISEDEPDLNQYNISLAFSAGHLWYTEAGRLKASSGYTTDMDLYNYEIAQGETPFDVSLSNDYVDQWVFSDRIWARFLLDNRDQPIGTTQGYGISQNINIGGILPINNDSHYIRSISNVDFYHKFLDKPLTEDWDLVLSLRLHAAYTRIFDKPGYGAVKDEFKTAAIDGMFVGRGWSSENDGIALLDLKAEVNMPLIPGMLGSSIFFDAANLWTSDEDVTNIALEDFKFSFGGSLGITNQIMPISFFIAKTFKFDENGTIEWSPEQSYNKIGGVVTWGISFNLNYLLQ